VWVAPNSFLDASEMALDSALAATRDGEDDNGGGGGVDVFGGGGNVTGDVLGGSLFKASSFKGVGSLRSLSGRLRPALLISNRKGESLGGTLDKLNQESHAFNRPIEHNCTRITH
jgi:hypothetical protein